jgi:predicted O-methyltransferase YrrM
MIQGLATLETLAEIESAVPAGGAWCSLEKATTLAAIIFGLRPKVVVELGVWMGGSAIPMAITLRHLGVGQLVAIDAWSAEASVFGQEDKHLQWWGETMGPDGHEQAYRTFMGRLERHGITSERCAVRRQRTDEAVVPSSIDLLHHDANHGPQVVADIERWAPSIRIGGVLIIDDLNWPGDHVRRARDRALKLGFAELYPLGTGCVMQRLRSTAE